MENSKQYRNNVENLKKAQSGDESATEMLIKDNYNLVISVARRFIGRGCDLEDLIQIGLIGMLKSIRSFDAERGCAFSTYAVPMIMGEIRKYLRDDGLIKVSRLQKQHGYTIMKEKEAFCATEGREPKISELCEITGLTREEISSALDAITPVTSLSSLIGDSDDMTLENTLAASTGSFDGEIEKIALMETIKTLDPLWKKIIMFRFFRCLSQQETAKKLGLTQVKISREEKKIFSFLREKLG